MKTEYPDVREAAATLISVALVTLAESEPAPVFTERVDYNVWERQGQESLIQRRREIWQHPLVLSAHHWWDRLPEMGAFRGALDANEVLRTRVDTMVGFPFATTPRKLDRLLILDLLSPLVEASRTYVFDRDVFDAAYARVEAGLLQDTVHMVEVVPLLGFDTCFDPELSLSDDLVIRLMTDAELSAAIQIQGVPLDAISGTTAPQISRFHQRALTKVHPFPIQIGPLQDPVALPFPSFEDQTRRLLIALRLVCGGSVTTGRPLRMQHPDDFDATRGYSASRSRLEFPDEDRPTLLITPEQVKEIDEVSALLAHPAVMANRSLQMALRRIVFAGSRELPEDRLVDLTIAAEALFIHGTGHGKDKDKQKSDKIVLGARAVLSGDLELGSTDAHIEQLVLGAYRRRSLEVHADPKPPKQLHLLDGTVAPTLQAMVEDLERLMRRAAHLILRQEARPDDPVTPSTVNYGNGSL